MSSKSLYALTKNTPLGKMTEMLALAEARGTMMYYALARLAREQGMADIADKFIEAANQEANHAGFYAVLNGMYPQDFWGLVRGLQKAETSAKKTLLNLAEKFRAAGLDDAVAELEVFADQEEHHGVLMQEILEQYGQTKAPEGKTYVCAVCGYEYVGDLDAEGDDYVCPICGQPKKVFCLKEEAPQTKQTVYDFCVTTGEGANLDLAEYKGKVILIVNTATGCGFTSQYTELVQMYNDYHEQGLVILDIPCNQFGAQAPGTDAEIHNFCTLHYNTPFPQMRKSDVNGKDQLPLYAYLKSQKGFEGFGEHPFKDLLEKKFAEQDPNWAEKPDIKWNFTKFVVDREGNVVARFEPTADMGAVEDCIKSLL